MEKCKAREMIGQPVFGFAEYSVLKAFALTLGVKIIAESAAISLRYSGLVPGIRDDAEDENKATDEKLGDR